MAKFYVKSAAFLAVAAMGLSANAAQAATAQAEAKASILTSVKVTRTADLDFGTIAPSNTSDSTVQVNAAGNATCGTGLVCSGTTSAAAFNVVGASGLNVAVEADTEVTLVNTSTAGSSMLATLTVSNPTLTLGTAASRFTVAGTLTVAPGQAEGAYAGTFNVNVNYQ